MNEPSNTPMMASAPGATGWISIWMKALTKPNEQTYAEIANSPGVKASTAYLWVFIGYLVQFFLSSLVQNASMRRLLEQYGGGNGGQFDFASGIAGRLITAVCGAPIAAIIGTLFFAIGIFIIQWIAKMFGGRGSADQLAYAIAAILTPFMLVSGVFGLLSAIPFVGFCFSVILGFAGIYILVLEVMAIKGVNQFGWGAAIGSLFIPGLVVAFLCACLVGVGLAVFGTALRSVFQQINQSLAP